MAMKGLTVQDDNINNKPCTALERHEIKMQAKSCIILNQDAMEIYHAYL